MASKHYGTGRVLHQTLLYRSIMSGLEWDHDLSKVPNRFCLETHQQAWLWNRIGG